MRISNSAKAFLELTTQLWRVNSPYFRLAPRSRRSTTVKQDRSNKMRLISTVWLLLLPLCTPTFANSISATKSLPKCFSCKRLPPSGGALFSSTGRSVAETERIALGESNTFWFMSIGVAMLCLAVWDRQSNLSSYPFPTFKGLYQPWHWNIAARVSR